MFCFTENGHRIDIHVPLHPAYKLRIFHILTSKDINDIMSAIQHVCPF